MQTGSILDKQFVGVHELRKNLPKLLGSLAKGEEPMVVTHQGKPAAILTSVTSYTQMLAMIDELQLAIRELADKDYIKELMKEEAKVKAGRGIPAEKVYRDLGI